MQVAQVLSDLTSLRVCVSTKLIEIRGKGEMKYYKFC